MALGIMKPHGTPYFCPSQVLALTIWALTISISKVASAGLGDLQDEKADFLRAVAEGYLNNREAFDYLTCRFVVNVGKAPSLENALAESPDDLVSSEGLWIVDGEKIRFELVCDPAVVRAIFAKGRGQPVVASPLPSSKFLSSGPMQLRLDTAIRIANVHPPGNPAEGIELGPFDMGAMARGELLNPGRVIQLGLEGKLLCEFEGRKVIEGAELLAIRVRESHGNGSVRYMLDPGRGYLPIQICEWDQENGELSYKLVVTKVRECSNGRWFPERSVLIWSPESGIGPFSVREIKVVELDCDNRPGSELFFMDIPEKTILSDASRDDALISLREAERVGLHDLQRLLDRCRTPVSGPQPPQALGPLPGSDSLELRPWWWAFGFAAAIFVTAFGIVVIRRSQTRKRT